MRDNLQAFRQKHRNRQPRLLEVKIGDTVLANFRSYPDPINPDFGRPPFRPGLNLIGWFRGDLGLGESVRAAARAADAADIDLACIDLKFNCLSPQTDTAFADRLREDNPFAVNCFHFNPPEARDIDHHYGPHFRGDRYNIAYWAWELPEFPDGWVSNCRFFQEIWCPSRFVADAISRKAPLPVVVMPHSIRPRRVPGDWRSHFGLPRDKVLFLFIFDMNSYRERKNPEGVAEAFRRAFPEKDPPAHLVIKTHNATRNPDDARRFRAALDGIPPEALHVIDATLPRNELTGLQSACDAFVSLHRSEGFGLNIAECMALGKPVVATDWSAPAEYVNVTNGFPVPAVETILNRDHGPYSQGQVWADPDLAAAAGHMRCIVKEPGLATERGRAAAAAIRQHFSPEAVGRLYRHRLRWIHIHQGWEDRHARG
ncbi:MAG: glycosyltransferase family 4 protein [Opitutales bacterium]